MRYFWNFQFFLKKFLIFWFASNLKFSKFWKVVSLLVWVELFVLKIRVRRIVWSWEAFQNWIRFWNAKIVRQIFQCLSTQNDVFVLKIRAAFFSLERHFKIGFDFEMRRLSEYFSVYQRKMMIFKLNLTISAEQFSVSNKIWLRIVFVDVTTRFDLTTNEMHCNLKQLVIHWYIICFSYWFMFYFSFSIVRYYLWFSIQILFLILNWCKFSFSCSVSHLKISIWILQTHERLCVVELF